MGITLSGCWATVGVSESNTQASVMASSAVKEVVPPVQKVPEKKPQISAANGQGVPLASKAQVVGWPPVRSFRKNSMAISPPKNDDDLGTGCFLCESQYGCSTLTEES